jgi:hypothetical protein
MFQQNAVNELFYHSEVTATFAGAQAVESNYVGMSESP